MTGEMDLTELTRKYFRTMRLGDEQLGRLVDEGGEAYERRVFECYSFVRGFPGFGDVTVDDVKGEIGRLRREGF